jgi:beta-lactamase regulating signal transducer with metallopeptidase domain
MTLLAGLAIRSALVLAAGLLVSACLSKRSAALRHRVLAGTLLAALLVMPFSLAVPEWTVALPAPAIAATPAVAAPPDMRQATAGVEPLPSTSAHGVSPLLLTWFFGVLVAAGTFIAGLVRVSRVAARATRVDDPRWLQVRDTVAARYRLGREIAIVRTDSPNLLATWGILRPQVLVPHHAHDWSLERVHVVLCHELAHIRRHDWLVQMSAEALRAILWFDPLAWMVCTRLRRESEQACDDEVLGAGVSGRAYATELLELARQCRRPGSMWASAMPESPPC